MSGDLDGQLIEAVELYMNAPRVWQVLADGANANARKRVTIPGKVGRTGEALSDTADCESALAIAIIRGYHTIVEELLGGGADPNLSNSPNIMARKKDANAKNANKSKETEKRKAAPPSAATSKEVKETKSSKSARRERKSQWVDDDTGDLNAQLGMLGLRLSDVSGDGNCLFRALSEQVHGDPHTQHGAIRHQICEYMAKNRDSFSPFCDEDDPFDRHLARMRRDGTYGENLEVVAFARAQAVDVAVHQLGQPVWIVRAREDGRPAGRMIHIVYHRWEHYSSVRNILGPHTGPPNIRITPTAPAPPSAAGGTSSSSTTASTSKPPPAHQPTSLERMIMQTTGEEDFHRVRALLDKYRMNVNRVFEELWQQGYGADADADKGSDDDEWVFGPIGDEGVPELEIALVASSSTEAGAGPMSIPTSDMAKSSSIQKNSPSTPAPADPPHISTTSDGPVSAEAPTSQPNESPLPLQSIHQPPPASTSLPTTDTAPHSQTSTAPSTIPAPTRPSRNAAKREAKRAQKERAMERKRERASGGGVVGGENADRSVKDSKGKGKVKERGDVEGAQERGEVGVLVDGMRTVMI
ncbi:OTU domain-containing protein 3 [Gonapodya sp. JEL0774]|nr:OTU domain-containing protein 3 [Gonapodya sp. JEL0774]